MSPAIGVEGREFAGLLGAALLGASLALLALVRRRRRGDALGLADLALLFAGQVWGTVLGALLASGAETGVWDPAARPSDLALLAGSAIGSACAAALALTRARPAALGIGAPDPRWVLRALIVVPAFLAISVGWGFLIEALGGQPEEQELVELLRASRGTLAGGLALLYAVLGAPVFEEIVFRGAAIPALERSLGARGAVLVSGLVFGALHGADPQAVPPLVLLGLALGWLRARSGSLWPPLALHLANNALVVALLDAG